jgi:hypothetical protein
MARRKYNNSNTSWERIEVNINEWLPTVFGDIGHEMAMYFRTNFRGLITTRGGREYAALGELVNLSDQYPNQFSGEGFCNYLQSVRKSKSPAKSDQVDEHFSIEHEIL